MKQDLTRSSEAMTRAGKATRYLLAVSMILFAALTLVFTHLAYRQNVLQAGMSEDALWAVYQLDRETRSLSETITNVLAGNETLAEGRDELTLRFDILFSRLSILDNAKYVAHFTNDPIVAEKSAQIQDLVSAMAPTFNRMAKSGEPLEKLLGTVRPQLAELSATTSDFLAFTNNAMSSARADARAEIMRLQKISAAVVAALLLTILLLVLNLLRQVRIVKSARRRLETSSRELEEAYRAADAGNRAKSQFMATIGHEIRTPLNAILGTAELLADADLPEQEMEDVRTITSSGQALLEIINEILDYAKIEHGDTEAECVPFRCGDLLAQAASVLECRARESGNELVRRLPESLRDRWFLSDPTQLRRVLLNLVSNAVKFTRDGRVTISAAEKSIDGAAWLRFEVTDTGMGIPEEARGRLFTAFNQVDNSISRRFGGTGLGLAICKRIVESLGGEIGVESDVGKGSKFWFEIPAEVASAASAPTDEAPAVDVENLPRLQVLLVEDNPVNCKVATQFLEKLGQDVTVANDGSEAVEAVQAKDFDLILMDMQMPVMDGIAATREIRSRGSVVPIVAMTANASDGDRELCVAAGMSGFELKPVSLRRLAAVVHTVSAGAQMPGMAAVEDTPRDEDADLAARDEKRVAELNSAIGPEGLASLEEAFISGAAEILHDLHTAMETSDPELYDRSLHSLKGSAENLGFGSFARLAEYSRNTRLDPTAVTQIDGAVSALGSNLKQANG